MKPKILAFLVLFFLTLLGFLGYTIREVRKPRIHRLSEAIVRVGDTVSIYGATLHAKKSRLFWADVPVYASSISKWEPNEIQFIVRPSHTSGYVFVENEYGVSNKFLLVVEEELASQESANHLRPVIRNVSHSTVFPGDSIEIEGKNFFSKHLHVSIPVNGDFFTLSPVSIQLRRRLDREFISFVLPSEVRSGVITISNAYGEARTKALIVEDTAEQKISDTVVYLISQYFSLSEEATFAYLDTFPVSSTQPSVALFSQSDTLVGEAQLVTLQPSQDIYVRSYVIEARKLSFLLSNPKEGTEQHDYLEESALFPLSHVEVRELSTSSGDLAQRIRGAYDNVVNRMQFNAEGSSDVVTALRYGQGNARAYAALLSAVLRSMAIPSRIVAGIFVNEHEEALPHYWVEFFYPGAGWIPCDPALEDGAYELSPSLRSASYFATSDARHLAFQERKDPFYIFPATPELYFSVLTSESDAIAGLSSYKVIRVLEKGPL